MRLSQLMIPVLAFALAAVASGFGARVAVSAVETRSAEGVEAVLLREGLVWATVLGDGLQVIIEGEAPSEVHRFRAMTLAGTVVDASRVIDNMAVTPTAGIAPPEFTMEILRNDGGVSVIGLVPAATDRDALTARIASVANGKQVTDLLEEADYPVPEGWNDARDYALAMLSRLPRAKISVSPGRVEITAIADSDNARRVLEAELARRAPETVRVATSVSAPRPVITPFTTRFILDDNGARFDVCVADSPAAVSRILSAARAAGLEGKADCPLALGVPSSTWGAAVAQSIEAVADLGGGTVTISDADISLVGKPGTPQGLFDRIAGELENSLPDLFALEATLPPVPNAQAGGPPQFVATLSPEGLVQLRGRVTDPLMNSAAENYARARFGSAGITMGTRVSEGLPPDWSVRVLAGIEALSRLSNGAVVVEPERIEISGKAGSQQAEAEISRLLIEKLGQGARFDISVEYVASLDPIAALPSPEECIDQVLAVTTDGRKITFDPGSATLAAEAQVIMDDIAEILRRCADIRIEIAGYTDSQGREEMNLNLSQQRARAVLDALRQRRVPVASFRAVGYGEADPIADNGTEEGREANRRIEFSLIRPEPIPDEPTTLEEVAEDPPVDPPAQDGDGAAAVGETGETGDATDSETTTEGGSE